MPPLRNTLKTCSVSWLDQNVNYGFQYGYVTPDRVQSKKIRGENGVEYTVVGSQTPMDNLSVKIAGARTNGIVDRTVDEQTGTGTVDGKLLWGDGSADDPAHYIYVTTGTRQTQSGDSGAPVFTVTSSTKNEVKIVGIHVGSLTLNNFYTTVFNSWDDVSASLGLKDL